MTDSHSGMLSDINPVMKEKTLICRPRKKIANTNGKCLGHTHLQVSYRKHHGCTYHCAHDRDIEPGMGGKCRKSHADTLTRVDISKHDDPEREKGKDRGLHLCYDQHEHRYSQGSKY